MTKRNTNVFIERTDWRLHMSTSTDMLKYVCGTPKRKFLYQPNGHEKMYDCKSNPCVVCMSVCMMLELGS